MHIWEIDRQWMILFFLLLLLVSFSLQSFQCKESIGKIKTRPCTIYSDLTRWRWRFRAPPRLSFIIEFIRFSRELWTIHYRIDTLRFLRILVIPPRRYGEKEEGKQKSWNTLRRVANANCRGPLTAGSKSLTALVCLSQTTNLRVVRVRGTCERSKNKPRY